MLQNIASIACAEGDLVVHGAWIRAAPPNALALAGYMTVENHSTTGKLLVGARSPAFGNVTIHRTEHVGGVARMSHVSKVDIAPAGKLVFQPDGYHLMLIEPKRPLRMGDRVPIELRFADGSRTSVVFPVREHERTMGRKENGPLHAGH